MSLLARTVESFVLGALTPLTAVCVLPLYPGFLAYLAAQREGETDASIGGLGGLVAAGVISFMAGLGVVFTTLLEVSLTSVVGTVSPIAFALLGAFSLLLLADVPIGGYLPTVEPPQSSHPRVTAFGYGFFFGAIVLPCNPGFIAVFFARAFLFSDPVGSMLQFLSFGLGIAAPLLGLAVVSDRWRTRVRSALTAHHSLVNRATGAFMLAVSVYYLVLVFGVVP